MRKIDFRTPLLLAERQIFSIFNGYKVTGSHNFIILMQ